MKTNIATIEDCLEIIVGMQRSPAQFTIRKEDKGILSSFASQVFKGTPLTDRQHDLAKEKLLIYVDQFKAQGYDYVEDIFDTLRMPLRSIDRSKYIKIVTDKEDLPAGISNLKNTWVKIRFPFSKQNIVKLQNVTGAVCKDDYYHFRGSHEHFFVLTELAVYNLIDQFKNSEFEIDFKLLELYNTMSEMISNKHEYIPGVYDLELKNVHANLETFMHNKFGKPDTDNLLLYKDRSIMFGLQEFDSAMLDKSAFGYSVLSKKIANRKTTNVLVDSKNYSLQTLFDSLFELERFPLLILCDEDRAEDQLLVTHNILKYRIPNEEMSVLFRLDGDHRFNEYVKEQQLNNFVDKNTKVVYISKNKIPKPLLKADWSFESTLSLSSYVGNSKVQLWITETDLTIKYDEEDSSFSGLGYLNRTRTEKIS